MSGAARPVARIAEGIRLSRTGSRAWVLPEEACWCVTLDGRAPPPPDPAPRVPEPPPRLAEVWLYTNEDCNLRCSHCFLPPRPLRPPPGSLLERAEEALRLGAETVYLTGGEPFLREDLEELVAALAPRATVVVLTNGTLVTPRRMERLAALVPATLRRRLAFQVSLDGSREVHDARRGNGAFDRAVSGIEALTAFGRPPAVSTTLTGANAGGAHEVTRMLPGLGCRVHHLFLPHVGGRLAAGAERLPAPRELLAAIRRCREAADAGGVILSNHVVVASRVRRPGRRYDGCVGGCAMLAVAADGSVYPCPSLAGRSGLADPPGTALVRAVSSGRCAELRHATLARRPRCGACDYRHFCGGGCAAHAYAAGGGYDAGEPYCEVYRGLIEDCLREESERLLGEATAEDLTGGVLRPSPAEGAGTGRHRFGCT
ncbi:MAG: radical SAM protein [Coriobacteriia bacterium]|nr:radical SAM protein [Coriobacteriia bacterium]